MKQNCLRCSHYLKCKDPAKSVIYVCSRFDTNRHAIEREAAILTDLTEHEIAPSGLFLPKSHDKELVAVDPNVLHGIDASEVIKKILEDKRLVSPDIRVPEDDFAKAPNFYRWCVSDKFLNQKPFVQQALLATKVFAEYCPCCSDVEWMNSAKVDDSLSKFERKVALLEHGVCPHCKRNRLKLYKKYGLKLYIELALNAGQRSGKSALLGMMFTYITHRLLKLERPNEVYGLLSSTVLQATFVALTFAQAKETLFDGFYGNILSSPWFQEYHSCLDHVERRHGEKELYQLNDTFVNYRHRRLMIYPAGPDKRILRGRTRFGAAIDELGWFPNDADAKKNVKMNADEVYTALDNSLATVAGAARNLIKRGFFDVPLSYFLNISSPSSIRDKICELVRKAQGSKYTYGLQKSTWEMNPTLPLSCSFLRKKFRDNPIDAMRDFGAQPPLTNSPFISNKDAVAACHHKSNKINIAVKYLKLRDGSQELYGELVSARRIAEPCALAIDAGYTNNSFAFAVGHLKGPGRPVIDCVGEVIPLPGIPVNYTYMYRSLISQLFAYQNIVLLAADRWNSLKILSDAEADFGVHKVQHSLKYLEMQLYKSYMLDGEILIPKTTMPIEEILKYNQGDYPNCFLGKPEDHFALQLLTVQDTGSQIIKGDRLTDDIARASMLCFQQLMDENNAELLSGPVKETAQRVDITQMAVGRQYSGGGSSNSAGFGGGMSNLGVIRGRA